jgi:glycosyltransferase involved in cell wall biosynthesis
MSPVKRVAHLIAPAPAGGAESVVLALASGAPDRSRVLVLNQVAGESAPPHTLTQQLRARGIVVEEIRCGRRRYAAEARLVAAWIDREGIDVLHTHGYHATVVGYFAARRARTPVVATVHGYLSRNLKERIYNVVDRWFLRRFDAVIAVSQGIGQQMLASGLDAGKLFVIQNGLTVVHAPDRDRARRELNLDASALVVGWVGRLSIEKGADLLLHAVARMDRGARVVVVGEGAEQNALDRLARELQISDRVWFVGFRPDASALLPAFDVLALSSRIEGTPMVILEAVAARVPIVAFRTGGIPDVLDDDSAWLVPPEDVAALAEALRDALAAPTERDRRATHAMTRLADRLSSDKWLERVWAAYEKAAS